MERPQKAVVLLSGGIDSTTTLAIAKYLGFTVYALSFDYGQRHRSELENARKVAKHFSVEKHLIFEIDLSAVAKSALTSHATVPKERSLEQISTGIPPTYVPARNLVFLSIALSWAETLEAGDVFIGANAVDYSGYPDCRPQFVEAFQKCAALATKAGVEGKEISIRSPLEGMRKAEIIQRGLELKVDYSLTRSCYDPSPEGLSCGKCDSCILRLNGFRKAGMEDPIEYAN